MRAPAELDGQRGASSRPEEPPQALGEPPFRLRRQGIGEKRADRAVVSPRRLGEQGRAVVGEVYARKRRAGQAQPGDQVVDRDPLVVVRGRGASTSTAAARRWAR